MFFIIHKPTHSVGAPSCSESNIILGLSKLILAYPKSIQIQWLEPHILRWRWHKTGNNTLYTMGISHCISLYRWQYVSLYPHSINGCLVLSPCKAPTYHHFGVPSVRCLSSTHCVVQLVHVSTLACFSSEDSPSPGRLNIDLLVFGYKILIRIPMWR